MDMRPIAPRISQPVQLDAGDEHQQRGDHTPGNGSTRLITFASGAAGERQNRSERQHGQNTAKRDERKARSLGALPEHAPYGLG